MFKRFLAPHIQELAKKYPVVTLLGPRQSGQDDTSTGCLSQKAVWEQGSHLIPIEIKSSKTFSPSFLEGLHYFHAQASQKALDGAVIYAGAQTQKLGSFQ